MTKQKPMAPFTLEEARSMIARSGMDDLEKFVADGKRWAGIRREYRFNNSTLHLLIAMAEQLIESLTPGEVRLVCENRSFTRPSDE